MSMSHELAQEYIGMGINLMKEEKYLQAKEMFAKALEAENSNYDAYIHMGNVCVNLNEMDHAIEAFNNALNAKENSGEALFSLGNVYYLQNDYHRAVKFYNRAEAVGFAPYEMYMIMTQIFTECDDGEQALRCINRALRVAPLRGEIWRKKVTMLIDMGRLETAEEALDEFLAVLPDAFDGYELQAKLLCAMERYDEASKKIAVARERFPDDIRIMLVELSIFSDAGAVEDAKKIIAVLKAAEDSDAYRKIIAMYESELLVNQEDADGAVKALEWALEKYPEDVDLLYTLLSIHIAKLEYTKIIALADKIITQRNVAPSLLTSAKFYRALSMKETGKSEEAMVEFKKLSKEMRKITIDNPSLTEVYILRLLCHCQLKEFDQALALADYLQNIAPNEADGHAYRHLIYKEMGNEEKSQQELEAARKLNPAIQE